MRILADESEAAEVNPSESEDHSEEASEEDVAEEESEEDRESRLQKEQLQMDEKTRKEFENLFDSSEDFTPSQEQTIDKYYKSGDNDFAELDQEQIDQEIAMLMKYGAIIEFLEPKARSFNNIPQAKSEAKRLNCPANDGSKKAHYLTTQGSKNQFEWRVKRASPSGNCTIRLSVDGDNYLPITPVGKSNFKFPCGRKVGYETATFALPRQIVSDDNVVAQLEFETELGTVVQCSDMIVQKLNPFKLQKCDPKCQNGGVCKDGVCMCGHMYEGEFCEDKISSSGSFSLLLFIFMLGLVIAGIGLLQQRDKFREEIKKYYSHQRAEA